MRRAILVAVVALVAVLPTGAAEASGGGGCGGPVTEAAGAAVAIRGFCFRPTILYAEPGETVTWLNRDPTQHNVLGSNAAWGSFETLRPDRTATYSFAEPGVYPYVCSWHPGMVGAVVVGDGGSIERVVDMNAVRPAVSLPPPRPEPLAAGSLGSSEPESSSPWKAVALAAAGFFLLTVIAAANSRRTLDRRSRG